LTELVHPVRCEWGDCDPAGIWFYPTLFRWLDATAHHLFRELGVTPRTLVEPPAPIGLPVVEARAQFRAPARFYDRVEVRCAAAEVRARRFRLEYRVVRPRAEGELEVLATAYEVRVCVAKHPDGSIAALDLPEYLHTGLQRFLAAPAGGEPVRPAGD
jgi:4-hydroxybenzoyl-CoA thioesterase